MNIFETNLDKCPANHVPLSPLTFLAQTAAVYPDHIALIHGPERTTWAEAFAHCRRLASALKRRGIGPGGFGVGDHEALQHRVAHHLPRLDLGLLGRRQRIPGRAPGAVDGGPVDLGQTIDVGDVARALEREEPGTDERRKA